MSESRDIQIKNEIISTLYWDKRLYAYNIQVEVNDGEVILTGTVPDYRARNLALRHAWDIRGVKKVSDQLQYQPTNFPLEIEKEIAGNVNAAILTFLEKEDPDIQIEVNIGLVTLLGSVDAYWKRWRLAEVIESIRGVTGVVNHLTVVPTSNTTDQDLANQIEAALERNRYIDAKKIIVRVAQGRVKLSGTQSTEYARERAFEIAAITNGVIEVEDDILLE